MKLTGSHGRSLAALCVLALILCSSSIRAQTYTNARAANEISAISLEDTGWQLGTLTVTDSGGEYDLAGLRHPYIKTTTTEGVKPLNKDGWIQYSQTLVWTSGATHDNPLGVSVRMFVSAAVNSLDASAGASCYVSNGGGREIYADAPTEDDDLVDETGGGDDPYYYVISVDNGGASTITITSEVEAAGSNVGS